MRNDIELTYSVIKTYQPILEEEDSMQWHTYQALSKYRTLSEDEISRWYILHKFMHNVTKKSMETILFC